MVEVVAAFLLVLACAAMLVPSRIAAVVVASIFSLLSCLFFFLLGAPDVALTEAAVGTGIGSVIFIWAAARTRGAGGSS